MDRVARTFGLPLQGSRAAVRGVELVRTTIRIVLLAAVVVVIVLAFETKAFVTIDNLKAILTSAALVGILACGMTFIVLSGNLFSLSLGITAAVGAMSFLYLLPLGLPLAIVLTMLLTAMICGVQGLMVGAWQANPIVVTIAAGSLQQGVVVWITGGEAVLPGPDAASFGVLVDPVAGIPFVVFVFAAVVAVCELLQRTTRFGRELLMVGDNRRAAFAAGLNVTAIGAGVFAAAGLCAGVCGVMLGAQSGRAEILLQGTLTFDALAAVLVGGSAIAGGRGAIWRSAAGAVVVAAVTDLLLLRGYDAGVQLLVKGVVVALVVVLIQLSREES